MVKNRRIELLQSATLNGIDFVEVASDDEMTLRVHFITRNPVAGSINGMRIDGGERLTTVPVLPIHEPADWSFCA